MPAPHTSGGPAARMTGRRMATGAYDTAKSTKATSADSRRMTKNSPTWLGAMAKSSVNPAGMRTAESR